MRIALISPKGPLYRHRGGIFRKSLRYMPLTLPTLAALVPAELEAEVRCYDEGIEEVPTGLTADLVGITVITGTAARSYELARSFRRRGIAVVLGGPHVTLVPDEAAGHADAVVVGYAEASWPQLLCDFAQGAMRPRYVQSADIDLAVSPIPDRSVLPRRRYLTDDVFEATRGCVHACSFCVVPSAWGRRPLQKPVDHVIEDIRRKGSRRAIFVDLNLIASKPYARALFRALTPLRIHWYGLATTLLCEDLPLLDLAAESGCRGLLMGLESVSPSSLHASHKRFNDPDRYRLVVERLHERKIALQGCFVFGLDADTPAVFEQTVRFALDAKIDLPRYAVATPFPGTDFHRGLEAEGRILTRDWDLYDGQHVVFQPKQMTARELADGVRRAWRKTYTWSHIARRALTSPAPLHVALATNIGYRWYARRLSDVYTCDWMPVPQGVGPGRAPRNAVAQEAGW